MISLAADECSVNCEMDFFNCMTRCEGEPYTCIRDCSSLQE